MSDFNYPIPEKVKRLFFLQDSVLTLTNFEKKRKS